MSFTARTEYDAREHYIASREVTRRTGFRYFPWILVSVVGALLLVGMLRVDEEVRTDLLLSSLPWIVLTLAWIALIPLAQRWAAKKLPERDPSVRGVQERVLDQEGFHYRGNGVNLDIPWHAVMKVAETKDVFLLFYNKKCAYYLPKRTLDANEVTGVRDLIRNKMSDKAALRSD